MHELSDFLRRYENTPFRHSETLLPALLSGKCILARTPAADHNLMPCRHYLEIYQHRAQTLLHYKSVYPQSLREDAVALCHELIKNPDEPSRLWVFTMPPYFEFAVFEAINSRRILGCFCFIDRNIIGEKEWEALWLDPDEQRQMLTNTTGHRLS